MPIRRSRLPSLSGVSSGDRVHAGRPRRRFFLEYDFPFRELAACRRRAGSPSLPSDATLKGCWGCRRVGSGLWHTLMHGRTRDCSGSLGMGPTSVAICAKMQSVQQFPTDERCTIQIAGSLRCRPRGFARCTLAASCVALLCRLLRYSRKLHKDPAPALPQHWHC